MPRKMASSRPLSVIPAALRGGVRLDPAPEGLSNLARLRNRVRCLIRDLTGYDIHKAGPGTDAYADIQRLIGSSTRSPIIFDVGANVGQTVDTLLALFPTANIHAFEPGRAAFESLTATHSELRNVHLNNFALGSVSGTQPFFANSVSTMSSFLPLGPDGCGEITDRPEVNVSTIDAYCSEHGIQTIDVLKSDTQGFELEVLKGSQRMLNERRIRLIYLEINFSKMYENLPRMDKIYGFLIDHGFDLYAFYQIYFQHDRASWTDALFIRSQET
jgi:FkbM family methyltransferase